MQTQLRTLVAAVALGLSGGVHAQSNEELKAMLDQAMKTIQELQGRVDALEQQKPAPARSPAAVAAPAAPAPVAARPRPARHPWWHPARWPRKAHPRPTRRASRSTARSCWTRSTTSSA